MEETQKPMKEMNPMELNAFLDPRKLPVKTLDGIPSFVERISGDDEKWNRFYERLSPFYGLSERIFGKLILGIDVKKEWEKVAGPAAFAKGSSIPEVSPGSGVDRK